MTIRQINKRIKELNYFYAGFLYCQIPAVVIREITQLKEALKNA